MFEHESTGELKITGCASYRIVRRFPVKFAVGSKVFIKEKAQNKGILVPVVIKNINRIPSGQVSSQGVYSAISYVDTFNRVWLEKELVWKAQAIDLAIKYWEKIVSETEKLIDDGSCE